MRLIRAICKFKRKTFYKKTNSQAEETTINK